MYSLFLILMVGAMVLNFIFVRILAVRRMVSLEWRILLGLTIINVMVIFLHKVTDFIPYTFVWWLFNVNFEFNFSSTYSALLLLAISIMALVVAFDLFSRRRTVLAIVWLIWGAAYLFLSYDETYMLHDFLKNWKIYFSILGAIMVIAGLFAAWHDRANSTVYLLMIFGLGVTASGGVMLDDVINESFLLEEFLEMAGTTIVLATTYTGLRQISWGRWPITRQVLVVATPAWVVVMVLIGLWPGPALEARYQARSVNVDYLDGALSLIGYRINDQMYQPGDWVKVDLYWRANQPLPENYAQSVRLISPDGIIMDQGDLPLGPPRQPSTNIWPVRFIFKQALVIETSESMPAPTSYWLSVNVWRAPWDDTRDDNMLLVSDSDQLLLLPDTPALTRIGFDSRESTPPAPNPVTYRFDNHIRLTGYELPHLSMASEETLQFWWKTDSRIEQDLVQFLHFQDIESGEYLIFDQPPMGNLFPTSGWPSGFQVIGTWDRSQTDADDLPAGTYDVFTGLYEVTSQQRIAVWDAEGQAVLDHRIYLGRLVIE